MCRRAVVSRAALAAVLAVLLQGCGAGEAARSSSAPVSGSEGTAGSSEPCRPVTRLPRDWSYDYTPARSLADLLGSSSGAVVAGRVAEYVDSPSRHVTMRVEVSEQLRAGAEGLVRADRLDLVFSRGATVSGTNEQSSDARDFAAAAPVGTRIWAIVLPAPPPLQRLAALPRGARLGEALAPQGLLLEDCGALLNSNDSLMPRGAAFRGYDALVDATRRLQD